MRSAPAMFPELSRLVVGLAASAVAAATGRRPATRQVSRMVDRTQDGVPQLHDTVFRVHRLHEPSHPSHHGRGEGSTAYYRIAARWRCRQDVHTRSREIDGVVTEVREEARVDLLHLECAARRVPVLVLVVACGNREDAWYVV